MTNFINSAPVLLIGVIAFAIMLAAAIFGDWLSKRNDRVTPGERPSDTHEGYLISAVLGLLALLLGFTFSLALDRYDARRLKVLDEANAIGTTYLRTQMLEEPYRTRISGLLKAYTDNRIILAKANPKTVAPLIAKNDRFITALWVETRAAFPSIKTLDFSSAYLESMNNLIDLDAARKAARVARVPTEVFLILFIYMAVAAGVHGYVLTGKRGRAVGAFMLVLLSLSLLLILDIDRPGDGGIREQQGPMESLQAMMQANPPSVFGP